MDWISVKKRLPKENIDVNVWDEVREVQHILRYKYGGWWNCYNNGSGGGETTVPMEPTHWMPIPKPPTNQTKR